MQVTLGYSGLGNSGGLGGRNWLRGGCYGSCRCGGSCRGEGLGTDSGLDILGEELGYGLGELSTLAGPVVDAVALQSDAGGFGAGVIGADNFDGAAIAGAILFNDDNTIVGLLAGANAGETDH